MIGEFRCDFIKSQSKQCDLHILTSLVNPRAMSHKINELAVRHTAYQSLPGDKIHRLFLSRYSCRQIITLPTLLVKPTYFYFIA